MSTTFHGDNKNPKYRYKTKSDNFGQHAYTFLDTKVIQNNGIINNNNHAHSGIQK